MSLVIVHRWKETKFLSLASIDIFLSMIMSSLGEACLRDGWARADSLL